MAPHNLSVIRVAIYARYSSDNQREESIVAQLRAAHEYARKKGYVVVGEYKDEELTGKNDKREDFQRLISDAKAGKFDVIIVHKFNRFARNRYDSAIYKRQLKRAGVKVESVTQPLDDSPESVLMEALLEGMDEYYSLDLAREVMKGMIENTDQLIHTGGFAPYGFRVNPATKQLEVDDAAARAVRIYFEGVRDDVPLPRIAGTLNDLGYRTQTGKIFTANSFATWAYNEKYIGNYVYNQTLPRDMDGVRTSKKKPLEEHIRKEGVLPVIIDPELFWLVNGKMRSRQHKPGRFKAKMVYLLSGKIICGNCGASYNASTQAKKDKSGFYSYYKCHSKCGNTGIRKDDIEKTVVDQLLAECFSADAAVRLVAEVNRLYQEHRKSVGEDVDPIKQEISDLTSQVENWMQALGKGIRGLEDRIVQAQNRQELLQEELRRIEIVQGKEKIDDISILKMLEEYKNVLEGEDEEARKKLLDGWVDQVVIGISRDIDDYSAEITFRVFANDAPPT